MPTTYQTIFETSPLANGMLALSLVFLIIGVFGAPLLIMGTSGSKPLLGSRRAAMILWAVLWNGVSFYWVGHNLLTAYRCHHALRDGTCQVVEGTVEVLHEQPYSGHASGDRIRIGGREFEVNHYLSTLGYNRTIAHGGVLKNGVRARLHVDGPMILKVEIGGTVKAEK